MKWGSLVVVTLVVMLMTIYEWPKMKQYSKKEKGIFALLTSCGWGLTLLLVLYPEMPGPTQLIAFIYKPLGKLLEK